MKLSKGDSVQVIAGKDKGKKGTILRVLADENRVIVTGINMVTRHIKKTPQNAGSTVKFERSIHASNVMIVDPKTGKPTRVGYKKEGKKKLRIAKKSGEALERVKGVEAEKKVAQEKKTQIKPATNEKPVKRSFWGGKKKTEADTADTSGRAEGDASQKTVTHVRSAGRGS